SSSRYSVHSSRIDFYLRYAPNRHASRHLQDRFSSSLGGTLSRASRNKDNIIRLQFQIRSLGGEDLFEREWNFFRTFRRLADNFSSIQRRVRISALSK